VHPVRKSEPSFLKFQEGEKAGSVYKAFHKELSALQKECRDCAPDPHLLSVTQMEDDGTDVWGIIERGEYGAAIPIRQQENARSYILAKDG